jgi:hypothetical protein
MRIIRISQLQVLENCDELFKYEELSTVQKEKKGGLDASLFVFRPNTNTFECLVSLAESDNNNGRSLIREFIKFTNLALQAICMY